MIVDYLLLSTTKHDPVITQLHTDIHRSGGFDKCLILEDEKYGECLNVTYESHRLPHEILLEGVNAFMQSNKNALYLLETMVTIDRNDDRMRDTYSIITAAFEWEDIPVIGIRVPPDRKKVTIYWKHTICPETFCKLVNSYAEE